METAFNKRIRRGDILYIRGSEHSGSEQSGDRPAVVIGNNVGNRSAPIIIVAYTTSRDKKNHIPTHVEIDSLPRKSIVLCEQIHTADKNRIEEHMGRVTADEMEKIDEAIVTSLALKKYMAPRSDVAKEDELPLLSRESLSVVGATFRNQKAMFKNCRSEKRRGWRKRARKQIVF